MLEDTRKNLELSSRVPRVELDRNKGRAGYIYEDQGTDLSALIPVGSLLIRISSSDGFCVAQTEQA